jgi:hypothetical protein
MCLVLDDLPFEFKALELVLELSCLSLDAQVCHILFIILLYDLLHDFKLIVKLKSFGERDF